MRITLNGEPHELPAPLTVLALLERLGIDPRGWPSRSTESS